MSKKLIALQKRIAVAALAAVIILPLQAQSQQPPKLSGAEKDADQYVVYQQFDKAEKEYLSVLEKKSIDQTTRDRVNIKLATVYYDIRRYSDAEGKYEAVMPNTVAFTTAQASSFLSTLIRLGHSQRANDVAAQFTAKEPFASNRGLLNLKEGLKYLANVPDTASYAVVKAPFNEAGSTFWCTRYDNGVLFIHIGNDEKAMLKGAEFYYFNGSNASLYTKIPQTMQAGPATFSKDGSTMMYTDNRYSSGMVRRLKNESLVANTLRIMQLKYNPKKQTWGDAEELFKDKDQFSICHPSLTDDGQRIYFSSNMTGTVGGMDIYLANKTEKGWGTPINLGNIVNTAGEELFAYVHGDYLIFSSNGQAGFGGQDIYMVKLGSDGFPLAGTLKHMPYPINSVYNDYAFMYDKGNNGYFSSDRPNGQDLDAIYAWTVRVAPAPKMEVEKPVLAIVPVAPIMAEPAKLSEVRVFATEAKDVAKELIAGSVLPDTTIYYGFNRNDLTKESLGAIDKFIGKLKGKTPHLLILGYADAIGSGDSNQELSKRRADVVRDYMVKMGYPADAIESLGKGQLELTTTEQVQGDDLKARLAPARKAEIKLLE